MGFESWLLLVNSLNHFTALQLMNVLFPQTDMILRHEGRASLASSLQSPDCPLREMYL